MTTHIANNRWLQVRSVAINKNLANYPLARDTRKHLSWRKSKPSGKYWIATLPGEDGIELRLAADAPKSNRRAPRPFDMAVLLHVIAKAQLMKTRTITFRSMSELLALLGYRTNDLNNFAMLGAALQYWSYMRIRFLEKWHDKGKYLDVTLYPPLQREGSARQVTLNVDEDWLASFKDGYFVEVPLPLPRDATAQNLILLLLTSASNHKAPANSGAKRPLYTRAATTWCRKVGLQHANRNEVLRRALDTAVEWFAQHGGNFVYRWDKGDDQIHLAIVDPIKIDRTWRTEPKTKAKIEVEVAQAIGRRDRQRSAWPVTETDEDGNKYRSWELFDGRIVDEVPEGYEREARPMPDHVRDEYRELCAKRKM